MKIMKTALKIGPVLVLSCAVSYGINYLIFRDAAFFTLSNIVVWLIMAALIVCLFVRGDLKPKE